MKKASLYVFAGLLAGGVSAKVDSGFYAGVGFGINKNSYKQHVTTTDKNPNPGFNLGSESFKLNFSKANLLPSLFVGYLCVNKNFAWSPLLRVGNNFRTAASHNLVNVDAQINQTTQLKKRFNIGLDFKLGRIVNENTFLYGLLGLDLNQYKVTYIQYEVANLLTTHQQKKLLPGIKFGVGVDFFATKNMFLGSEVSYTLQTRSLKTANFASDQAGVIEYDIFNKLRPRNNMALKIHLGWKI